MIKHVYGKGLIIAPDHAKSTESKYLEVERERDASDFSLQGRVLHKGDAPNTEIGDLVVFDQFEHRAFTIGDKTYVYIKKEEDLICKLESNE